MRKIAFGLILSLIVVFALTCVGSDNLEKEKAAVKKVIVDGYVNGFFNTGGVDAINRGFHKDCNVIGFRYIDIKKMPISFWTDFFTEHPPGSAERDVTHKFLSVTVTGRAASAVVEIHLAGKHQYTSHLLLYQLKEGWRIVSQVVNDTDYKIPKERKTAAVDPALYDAYIGRYRADDGMDLTVSKSGAHLFIQAPMQPKMEFFPESETVFFSKSFGVTVTFEKMVKGQTMQLVMRTDDREIAAKRMMPRVAVFSSRRKDFKISEVAAGPFDSKKSALEKYGKQLPGDLEIAPASPKGMAKGWFVLKAKPVIGTRDLETVNRARAPQGEPGISFSLKPESAEKLKAYTTANRGKRLAIMLDNQVLSAPRIVGVISKNGMITGKFTIEEINEIVMLLKIAINEN